MSDPPTRPRRGPHQDAGHETDKERRDRELIELLNELRVVLTGVQVLFAFLLTLPFTERFHDLTPAQRLLFSVAFTVTTLASVLLIAPTAYHRLRFRQQDKEHMLRWANRFAITGIGLLAVAIGTIALLVIEVLYGLPTAGAVAGAVMGLTAWTWFALPLTRRLDDEESDGSDR